MRHSDIKLTAKVYTDETQLPIYDAIKNLPRLNGVEKNTQIRAQNSGARGQNVAQADAVCGGVKAHETPVNGWVCRGLAQPVAVSVVERVKGIEPCVLIIDNEWLASFFNRLTFHLGWLIIEMRYER
jgi:hypothetical protein